MEGDGNPLQKDGAASMESEECVVIASPQRAPVDAATVEATSTPAAAERPSSSLFPTPIQNEIAKVKPKEDDPFFDKEVEIDGGVTLNVYKEVGPFWKDVQVQEALKYISVSESGPSWTAFVKSNQAERTNYFRTHAQSLCPPHLPLAFDQPIQLKFVGTKKDNRGRKRTHELVIGMFGYCSAKVDNCPTVFVCGFTEETMRTLLKEELPESIELLLAVTGACHHLKGKWYGQLRGNERQNALDEYNESNKKPSEFAKSKLMTITDSEFHSKNRGVNTTREIVYNLSREAKAKKLKESGFTECSITNAFKAQAMTTKEDLSARAEAGNSSKDLPGIARLTNINPTFRVFLWTKSLCTVFYQLAKGGQIVLNMDATGGLLDFPLSDDDQKCKILHTKVAVKPLYSLVDAEHMRDKTVARMVSPLTVAEMASNSNKATDIAEFLHCFFKDVKRVGKSEIPVNPPLLCQSDCSAALEAGALRAFSNSDKTMATTRIEYSNITLLHLLHYDCLTKDLSASESRKQPALAVLNSMKPSVPTFLKECSAHVCRAPPKWVKRTEGVEGSETKSRFENLMWSVFLSLIHE